MKRIYFVIILFSVLGVILWSRLFWLQTVCAEELKEVQDKQSICTVELTEENRGEIVDCNGLSFTADTDTTSLVMIPALIDDAEATAEKIAELFGLDEKKIYQKITGGKNKDLRLQPFVACSDLTAEDISLLEQENIKGAVSAITSERLQKSLPAQHLIGTLETDGKGNINGVSGLEKIYDTELKGIQTRTLRFRIDEKNAVNTADYYNKTIGEENHSSVTLTIDSKIQAAAESALGSREGAVVVLNSKNGDILAMASSAKYDFYGLKKNTSDCYINKALAAEPPGSLFKVFTAAVALENHLVTANTPFICNGKISFQSGQTVSCWEKEGHGKISFADAVAKSCNPAMIKTTEKIGMNRLLKAFHKWELDSDNLIGYPLNTTSELKKAENEIALANIALGESGVKLTPLNAAKMLNVIASGGYVLTPRVVTEVKEQTGTVMKTFGEALPVRVISAQTAAAMMNILKRTFTVGTGASLGLQEGNIAGKTGSSETGNVWIGGFFPADQPQYTVVVLVKNGSGGAADAGPVFKKLYLSLQDS